MRIIEEADKYVDKMDICDAQHSSIKHIHCIDLIKFARHLDEKYELKPRDWQREAFGHLVDAKCNCANNDLNCAKCFPCEHPFEERMIKPSGERYCGVCKFQPEVEKECNHPAGENGKCVVCGFELDPQPKQECKCSHKLDSKCDATPSPDCSKCKPKQSTNTPCELKDLKETWWCNACSTVHCAYNALRASNK